VVKRIGQAIKVTILSIILMAWLLLVFICITCIAGLTKLICLPLSIIGLCSGIWINWELIYKKVYNNRK